MILHACSAHRNTVFPKAHFHCLKCRSSRIPSGALPFREFASSLVTVPWYLCYVHLFLACYLARISRDFERFQGSAIQNCGRGQKCESFACA
jgi:hypothetical protein